MDLRGACYTVLRSAARCSTLSDTFHESRLWPNIDPILILEKKWTVRRSVLRCFSKHCFLVNLEDEWWTVLHSAMRVRLWFWKKKWTVRRSVPRCFSKHCFFSESRGWVMDGVTQCDADATRVLVGSSSDRGRRMWRLTNSSIQLIIHLSGKYRLRIEYQIFARDSLAIEKKPQVLRNDWTVNLIFTLIA